MSPFAPIIAALVEGGGRFVLVGGLATVLHGYTRLTIDVDVMVDLAPGEAIKPIAALTRIGLLPRAPVNARDFADADARRRWIEEKGMRVFSMWSPQRPLLEVDIFVEPPLPFDEVWGRAEVDEAPGRPPQGPGRHHRAGAHPRAEGSAMSREDWGTWEDAARRSQLKGLELTVAERFAWLEAMWELAEAHGATAKPRDAWGQPIEPPPRSGS